MAEDRGKPQAPRTAAGDLDFIVSAEAMRVLSQERIEADPARVAAGWERRFIADASRVQEMTKLYTELGFEVVADPLVPQQLAGECEDCRLLAQLEFKMIYTRKRA
jgi:hypothetical protein